MPERIIYTLLTIPGFLMFFTIRGYAQAWTAKKLGDDTPERNGFLTFNPIQHINVIGFICLLVFHFGFGKNVPTNSRYYKNFKRDSCIQALSAPAGSLIAAFVFSFITSLLSAMQGWFHITSEVYVYLFLIFLYATTLCVNLTLFFLIPLPGFDGYKVLATLLPYKYYRQLYVVEKYSLIVFLVFIALLNYVPWVENILIGIPSGFITNGFYSLWGLIF